DAGEQDPREVDTDDEAVDLDVAETGQDVDQPAPGHAAEEEEQAERERPEQRPRAHVTAHARETHEHAGEEENGDDREASVVEELPIEEPGEDLVRAVRVVEEATLVVLAPRRQLRVADE